MTRWVAVLGLVAIAIVLLSACGGRPSPQVTPTRDRPTFVWIFSDP